MESAPSLLNRASERSSGQTELRARAFAEMERSRRTRMVVDFLKYAADATVSVGGPIANRLLEVLANRTTQVFPEFKNAQQAFAYLSLSLTQTQLEQIFPGKPKAGGAVLALLTDAARMQEERAALEHASDLLGLFRDNRFRDVATAEQQLAGNYINGRMAIYRMHHHDVA